MCVKVSKFDTALNKPKSLDHKILRFLKKLLTLKARIGLSLDNNKKISSFKTNKDFDFNN
jgi:hypothetical protein